MWASFEQLFTHSDTTVECRREAYVVDRSIIYSAVYRGGVCREAALTGKGWKPPIEDTITIEEFLRNVT